MELDDLLAPRRENNDFRWVTRNWVSSAYFVRGRLKDPRELVPLVMSSEKVVTTIREVSQKEKKDEAEVRKAAEGILKEMAHDYHLYAIRWFAIILSKLGKRLYSSVWVNPVRIDEIRENMRRYPVLLLPTHRSYVDFLLVSYICFHYHLPIPIIAAGMDFMGMSGVGEFLRKSGAFFIRRKFGDDTLYWALISEYVKKAVLEGGHPLEMFLEGTRSRSAKTLIPKTGLLSVILDLVWTGQIPDIIIQPISMSYDRTLEEKLYAHELLGQRKPKETTNGLIRALRWLNSQSYGCIYVNFGEPISVRECLQKTVIRPSPTECLWFSKTVNHIAVQVVLQNQAHLIIPIFPVVAVVILCKLSMGSIAVDWKELTTAVTIIEKCIESRGSKLGYLVPKQSLECNIQKCLDVHAGLVTVSNNVVHLRVDGGETVTGMQLQHYANQVLPHLVPFAFISILRQKKRQYPNIDACQEYVFLRQLFSHDFLYETDTEMKEFAVHEKILNAVLGSQSNGLYVQNLWKSCVEPFILAYWAVAVTLLEQWRKERRPIDVGECKKMSQCFLQDKISGRIPRQYGSLSTETMGNCVAHFIQTETLSRVSLEKGAPGVLIQDEAKLAHIAEYLARTLNIDPPLEPVPKTESSHLGHVHLRSKL